MKQYTEQYKGVTIVLQASGKLEKQLRRRLFQKVQENIDSDLQKGWQGDVVYYPVIDLRTDKKFRGEIITAQV